MPSDRVPLAAFLDPATPPKLGDQADEDSYLLRFRALARNPYSWFWASALAIAHAVPALLISRTGAVLVPLRVLVRAQRLRVLRLVVAALAVAGMVAEFAVGRYRSVLGLAAIAVIAETAIYMSGMRAVYDRKEDLVVIKHLPKYELSGGGQRDNRAEARTANG